MRENASKNKLLVLVKIGGSLITDKSKPFSLKKRALRIISEEIKKAQEISGKTLIVGHGAGSFAHVPASKYKTHLGVSGDESYQGMAVVADVAAQLNRIVVKQLLESGVNAMSFAPHSFMTARGHGLEEMWTSALEMSLVQRQLPVVYGDQMIDFENGCTIFSTERVLGYLALDLKNKGYVVEKVIHCGKTNGVYGVEGETIPLITGNNIEEIRGVLNGSSGTDVTGGMIHKVEEALELASLGIPGMIIDGIENGSLSEAVMGKEVLGTRVEVT